MGFFLRNVCFTTIYIILGNHQRLQQDQSPFVLLYHHNSINIHACLCHVSDPNGASNARLGTQEEQSQLKSDHLLS